MMSPDVIYIEIDLESTFWSVYSLESICTWKFLILIDLTPASDSLNAMWSDIHRLITA